MSGHRFRIGQIYSFSHVAHSLDPRVPGVYQKTRPGIVAAVHEDRMWLLPMYTNSGNGLKYKPDRYKATAISVWKPTDQGRAHTSLLTTERLHTKMLSWKPGSHINLAEPVSIVHSRFFARLEDELEEDSKQLLLKRLWQLFTSHYHPFPWNWYKMTVNQEIVRNAVSNLRANVLPGSPLYPILAGGRAKL